MKAMLDTCVLYPPILREILIAVAKAGGFEPVWSDEIISEWHHIAERDGAENAALVASEIALLAMHFPDALIDIREDDTADLILPDQHDLHVLAAARKSGARVIVTANLRDFPRRDLAHFDIQALHPDAFLRDLWGADARIVEQAVDGVLARARNLANAQITPKQLLKRARLPRLAKALGY